MPPLFKVGECLLACKDTWLAFFSHAWIKHVASREHKIEFSSLPTPHLMSSNLPASLHKLPDFNDVLVDLFELFQLWHMRKGFKVFVHYSQSQRGLDLPPSTKETF